MPFHSEEMLLGKEKSAETLVTLMKLIAGSALWWLVEMWLLSRSHSLELWGSAQKSSAFCTTRPSFHIHPDAQELLLFLIFWFLFVIMDGKSHKDHELHSMGSSGK